MLKFDWSKLTNQIKENSNDKMDEQKPYLIAQTTTPTNPNEVSTGTWRYNITQSWNTSYETRILNIALGEAIRDLHLATTPKSHKDGFSEYDSTKLDNAMKFCLYLKFKTEAIPQIQKSIDDGTLKRVSSRTPSSTNDVDHVGEKRPRDEESPPTIAKKPTAPSPFKCRIIISSQRFISLSLEDRDFLKSLRQVDGGWSSLGDGKEKRLLVEFDESGDNISIFEKLMKMGFIIEMI